MTENRLAEITRLPGVDILLKNQPDILVNVFVCQSAKFNLYIVTFRAC